MKKVAVSALVAEFFGEPYQTEISDRGYWLSADKASHFEDAGLADELLDFLVGESVIDFGCGTGFYVQVLSPSTECRGYDGNPLTPELAGARCSVLDLSQSANVLSADWVLSLEVGEHIPRTYESTFIGNRHRHNTAGIILSWAEPGQGGIGHCNERPQEYVIDRFTELGYQLDWRATDGLRDAAMLNWLKKNLLVFRR